MVYVPMVFLRSFAAISAVTRAYHSVPRGIHTGRTGL